MAEGLQHRRNTTKFDTIVNEVARCWRLPLEASKYEKLILRRKRRKRSEVHQEKRQCASSASRGKLPVWKASIRITASRRHQRHLEAP